MNNDELLIINESYGELTSILNIALEALYIVGHQQMVSAVNDKMHKFSETLKSFEG